MNLLRLGVALGIVAGLDAAAPTQPASTDRQLTSAQAPRTDHALGFYDLRLRRVVLVGGAGDPKPGDRDKVWSWSGTRWEPVTDSGPPGRVNASAAYDAGRERAVVAGGSRKAMDGALWEVVGDSWEEDRDGWKRIDDIAPRDHQSLVEDNRGGILMYGGIPAARSGPWPTDTWALQGGTWKRVSTDGPRGRGRTALAYDSKRRRVVLFGGVSAPPGPNQPQTFFNDTWTWDGERWHQQAAEAGPRGRYAHAMVFDERAGVVLLYGGSAAHRDAALSDMWQWDGERWTEIRMTGPTPGHRYQPVMVYDRARDRTVLYGGSGAPGDTWEWDGQRWQKARVQAGPGPIHHSPRAEAIPAVSSRMSSTLAWLDRGAPALTFDPATWSVYGRRCPT